MSSKVPAVRLIQFPLFPEPRGSLVYGQYDDHLPFAPVRFFLVFGVPQGEVRGDHAHRRAGQVLVCVKGSCVVAFDDGKNRDIVILDTPAAGLYLPPLVWATQQQFTSDAALLVFCSETYDADEYIRDYDEFLGMVERV